MGDWCTNPVVWISAITALVMAGRAVFLIGQWKGKVDEAQSAFKTTLESFMEEIRADIKRIFERIGPATATGGSPIGLIDSGRKISARLDPGAARCVVQGLAAVASDPELRLVRAPVPGAVVARLAALEA